MAGSTATPSEAMERVDRADGADQASLVIPITAEQHAAAGRGSYPCLASRTLKATETTMTMTTLRVFRLGCVREACRWLACGDVPDKFLATASAEGSDVQNSQIASRLGLQRYYASARPTLRGDDFVPETEEKAVGGSGRQLAEAMEAAGEAAKASEFGPGAQVQC